jgi:hypothetical protein
VVENFTDVEGPMEEKTGEKKGGLEKTSFNESFS